MLKLVVVLFLALATIPAATAAMVRKLIRERPHEEGK